MSIISRFIRKEHYIIDLDNRMVHKISKLSDKCNISNNFEYATSNDVTNVEIYDYFQKCPYCFFIKILK